MLREEIKTKLLEYGGLYELIRKKGIITVIGYAVLALINIISKRFYRFHGIEYGLPEALFHPKDIDRWSRYAYVINEIKKRKQGTRF